MRKLIILTLVLALVALTIGCNKKEDTPAQTLVDEPTFTLFGMLFTYEEATGHRYRAPLQFAPGIAYGLNENQITNGIAYGLDENRRTKIISLFNGFMGMEYGFWNDPCLEFNEITGYMKEEGVSFEGMYEVIKGSPELKGDDPFVENGVLPYAPCLTEECLYDCEVGSHERRFVRDWDSICSALGKNEIMEESILERVREDLQVLKEKRRDLSQDPPLKFPPQVLPAIPASIVKLNADFPFAWIAAKVTACVSGRE